MNEIVVRLRTVITLSRLDRVWLSTGLIMAVLVAIVPAQGQESLFFAAGNLLNTAPYLYLSIGIAAYAGATGADNLIAGVFTGNSIPMIIAAAAFGALSPFCSCGVIPLIAALLTMGVPLAAVMAFWLASPVIDPSMFALTSGVLGFDFALAKTIAAISLGLFGGFSVHVLAKAGWLTGYVARRCRKRQLRRRGGACTGACRLVVLARSRQGQAFQTLTASKRHCFSGNG